MNFEGGSIAQFNVSALGSNVGPSNLWVELNLRPIANTIYLFDFMVVSTLKDNLAFTYTITGSEVNLMGEAETADDHLLFAVKAPSASELRIRIYKPASGWYFYNCQVIPQK